MAMEKELVFTREQCLHFARHDIATVFGPEFAQVDTFPTRVRLPDEPLMFVDRITHIEGKKGSLSSGRLITEHDIKEGAWYLDNNRMPIGMAVEAGQADLFLSSWLGIDLRTRGEKMYRLLDAVVTFHGPLPTPGTTVKYDIRIDKFICQGETFLFFFNYDGTVDGKKLITMRDGCAGFFSKAQLEDGRGLVFSQKDLALAMGKVTPDWRMLAPFAENHSLPGQNLLALRQGNLPACFGDDFRDIQVNNPLTIPNSPILHLIDQVISLDLKGGRFGMGIIWAEKEIIPDAWFLTSHFVDDMVMPGTLMYESCMQALRVLLLRMGWIASADRCTFDPIPEIKSQLRCRGQVIPGTKKAIYQIEIKELGYKPQPYCIADAIMFADDRPIVQCLNMSVQLTGANRQTIEEPWLKRAKNNSYAISHAPMANQAGSAQAGSTQAGSAQAGSAQAGSTQAGSAQAGSAQAGSAQAGSAKTVAPTATPSQLIPPLQVPAPNLGMPQYQQSPAIYPYEKILAYALHNPSDAFGPPYKIFDQDKFLARLPNPPYLFVHRITAVSGQPFSFQAGGGAEGEYDIPSQAWYFYANKQSMMPFSILLEFPLQICGWYAAYIGSALTSEPELHFRNLDGRATLYRAPHRQTGTLKGKVKLNSISSSGGMIIQKFDLQVFDKEGLIYDGDTLFGFFTKGALAQQIGIRGAKPWKCSEEQLAHIQEYPLKITRPLNPTEANSQSFEGKSLTMPAGCLLMNDKISYLPDGGPHGLGFYRGEMGVRRSDWYFDAHFLNDPVIPGSLGLEAFLQLLKAAALLRWGKEWEKSHHFQPLATGITHNWSYRGQIIPTDNMVITEAVITGIDDASKTITGDGWLMVDNRIIYKMENFSVRAVPIG